MYEEEEGWGGTHCNMEPIIYAHQIIGIQTVETKTINVMNIISSRRSVLLTYMGAVPIRKKTLLDVFHSEKN